MALRILRVVAGALLGASGALMYAASWERWAGVCPWGDGEGELCSIRQDHLYDFVAPTAPWEPVGDASQLAGWSLLVLALGFVPLPWALTGRRPGIVSAVALVGTFLAVVSVGVGTLRSGLTGELVNPFFSDVALFVYYLAPLGLLIRFAIDARGWALAAAVWLVLATPLVAAFSYAIGSYDAKPWWEAISGALTVIAGVCLLGAAAFSGRFRTHENADAVASPAPARGVDA